MIEQPRNDQQPQSPSSCDVLIVGAGVIGLMSAIGLREAGLSVVLCDQKHIGAGSSSGNMGMITPSHAPPLTRPQTFSLLPRALLSPSAPVRVKMRFNRQFRGFATRFLRSCTKAHFQHAASACHQLLMRSRTLYDALAESLPDSFDWAARGLLTVSSHARSRQDFEQEVEWLTHLGIAPKWLSRDEMFAIAPALSDSVASGWLHEQDAHLKPDCLLQALLNKAQSIGVHIRDNAGVVLSKTHRTDTTVTLNQKPLRASNIVVTAGAWTPALLGDLMRYLPIEVGKGYSLTSSEPLPGLDRPLLLHDASAAITPWASSWRVGGTMEFCGPDPSLNKVRLDALRKAARDALKTPVGLDNAEPWAGFRPMSADGIPVIGRVPGCQSVYVAAGHSMLGVSMAPATAELVTALLCDTKASIDPEPYNPARFR